MKLKTLLEIYAATAAVICLNFLAIPGFWIHLYGAQADTQAVFLYRLIATLFGGLAVMAWSGRAAEAPATRETMVRGLVVTNGLAALVAVLGAASGVYNQFAWGPAAMFAGFTLALLGATPTSPPSRTPS
jgi:hypothetical protein